MTYYPARLRIARDVVPTEFLVLRQEQQAESYRRGRRHGAIAALVVVAAIAFAVLQVLR